MQLVRPALLNRAGDPRRFGRGPARWASEAPRQSQLAGEIKLFATTFLAGFLFVSILIG
jgi:hypothetical protein